MRPQKNIFLPLLVFLLLFAGRQAYAVRLVPSGSIPQNRPLQPLPAGTAPNVNQNINSPSPETAPKPAAESENLTNPPNTNEEPPLPLNPASSKTPSSTAKTSWYWIIAIFFLTVLGLVGYRISKRKD